MHAALLDGPYPCCLVQVSQAEWDACATGSGEVNPFLLWAFLHALEESGSAVRPSLPCPHQHCIEDLPAALRTCRLQPSCLHSTALLNGYRLWACRAPSEANLAANLISPCFVYFSSQSTRIALGTVGKQHDMALHYQDGTPRPEPLAVS